MKTFFYALGIVLCTSCSKNIDDPPEDYNSTYQTLDQNEHGEEWTVYEVYNEQNALTEFAKLKDSNFAFFSTIMRNFSSSIVKETGQIPNGANAKKFKDDFLGRPKAANYAGGIMNAGGCVKAWIADGYIHVIEIPC